MNKNYILLLTSLIICFSIGLVSAEPNGVNHTTESDTSAAADPAEAANATAGNVTELTITGYSNTQAWQGFYGNVSGVIQLADSSRNILYNWSLASPQGEIYATNATSVSWGSIACINWTDNGTYFENMFGIGANDVDGINETFSDSNSHEEFFTGSTQFSAGDCMTAFVFDSTQSATDNNFEEALLVSGGTDLVFASLLEDSTSGFDGRAHDFEMLVLDNGHNGDTSPTTYYFYAELE